VGAICCCQRCLASGTVESHEHGQPLLPQVQNNEARGFSSSSFSKAAEALKVKTCALVCVEPELIQTDWMMIILGGFLGLPPTSIALHEEGFPAEELLAELPHRDEGYNVKEPLATFNIVDLKMAGCDAMELNEAVRALNPAEKLSFAKSMPFSKATPQSLRHIGGATGKELFEAFGAEEVMSVLTYQEMRKELEKAGENYDHIVAYMRDKDLFISDLDEEAKMEQIKQDAKRFQEEQGKVKEAVRKWEERQNSELSRLRDEAKTAQRKAEADMAELRAEGHKREAELEDEKRVAKQLRGQFARQIDELKLKLHETQDGGIDEEQRSMAKQADDMEEKLKELDAQLEAGKRLAEQHKDQLERRIEEMKQKHLEEETHRRGEEEFRQAKFATEKAEKEKEVAAKDMEVQESQRKLKEQEDEREAAEKSHKEEVARKDMEAALMLQVTGEANCKSRQFARILSGGR